jgi:outer membrane protein insertion porin family
MIFMLTVFAAPSANAATELAQAAFVQEIIVEGMERIEPGTVKSYLLIREGDRYDVQRVDRSLKSLFATGLFADVSIRQQGGTLVVRVVENPVINRIAFEGNKAVSTEVLESEISLRPRVIYTRSKVQSDVKRMLTIYRLEGHFAVTVEPKVIQLAQNRVDLVYEIAEGEPTEVESVRFVGNREYGDRRLRGVVETKEAIWFRVFSTNTVYDPDRVTLDRELLRRFYLSEGFADFRVNSAVAELTPDRKEFFITYTVDEGSRYALGDITVDAKLRDLKVEQIKNAVELESGDWYDITEVDKAVDAITNRVGELGYAFVDVRPRVKRDRKSKTISIAFEVKEGPRVFVERIDIAGNVRTLDKVIRREFQLVEGDAFNSAKIRRSRQRLRNLNFFETVKVEQIPGSAPDKTVVKVEVQEKSTGTVSIGAGYSSAIGAIGEFGLAEKNFLGRGQKLSLKFTMAAKRSQVDFAFSEPYFMNREVNAGFNVFHVRQNLEDTSSINTSRSGIRFNAGYYLTDDVRQNWSYDIRKSKIDDVSSNAAALIKAELGTEYGSEVGHKIGIDTRDSAITPTSGYSASFATDVAGLGGTLRHMRNTVQGGYYYPVADQWILSAGGKFGYIVGLGKDVHFRERYYIGGEDLRGFETAGVGPRDGLTGDSLGAEWMYTGTVSLSVPLGLPAEFGMSGRVFTDFGSSGHIDPSDTNTKDEGSLRASAGLGVTWVSPFGPLGIDAGIPLAKESFDKTELIRINFGAQF